MAKGTGRGIVVAYLTSTALFTLSASLIWGVNTLFLLGAGLTIFQAMLANTAFAVGQLLFEVPTGVLADTIGRRRSYLIGLGTILAATLLYVAADFYHLGLGAFAAASVLLGFGFTCQTGAVDAWLVDALDATGHRTPREQVFAWGGMVGSVAMLVGTLSGGFLGQASLRLPYLVRSVMLLAAFVQAFVMVRDVGFEPRVLRVSTFGAEARAVMAAGVRYGWGHAAVRPLLFASLVPGFFTLYGFYSWQPYALQLLQRDLVWVVGVLTAGLSVAGIAGNALVRPVMRSRIGRLGAPRLLAAASGISAVLVAGTGLVGLLVPETSRGPLALALASVLYLMWGAVGGFGFAMPVRQAYINSLIPSSERATVLSLDALFSDAGAGAGQPALGYLAQETSIATTWVVGGVILSLGVPLYVAAARAVGDGGEPRGE